MTRAELYKELELRYGGDAHAFACTLRLADFPTTRISFGNASAAYDGFAEELQRCRPDQSLRVFEELYTRCPISPWFKLIAEKLRQIPAYSNFYTDILQTIPFFQQGGPGKRSLTWLHITDFHCGVDPNGWFWPPAKETFYEDLQRIVKKSGVPDIVFFTGDHVQKAAQEEFEALNEALTQLWTAFSNWEGGKAPILASVPGNHDVHRLKDYADSCAQQLRGLDKASNGVPFWSDPASVLRKTVNKVFEPYCEWQKNHPFPKPAALPGLLPGEFIASHTLNGIRVGMLGLNTACCQIAAGDYEKRLSVHNTQLTNPMPSSADWKRAHDLRFVLSHHPPEWLTPASQIVWTSEIAPAGRFHLHLFGHRHANLIHSYSKGAAPTRTLCQTASLMGLESFGEDGNPAQRVHGYTIGQVQIDESGTARVRFWPRLIKRHDDNGWFPTRDDEFVYDEGGDPQATEAKVLQ